MTKQRLISPKGKTLNRAEMAGFFGVAKTSIDEWIRRGCPVQKKANTKGKRVEFNSAEVFKWAVGTDCGKL